MHRSEHLPHKPGTTGSPLTPQPPCPPAEEDRVAATLELTDDSEEADIKDLVKANKLPTTIEFTQESSSKIFGAGIDKQVGGSGLAGHGWAATCCHLLACTLAAGQHVFGLLGHT